MITLYLKHLYEIINDMSPYLLLGFIFAGILHVYFPQKNIHRFMGSNSVRSAFNASLLGVPLPLCSCGVIPTGISFYKNGASKAASVSFLISTPQTGVDSILVTYSMLGLPFALIRPVIALFTGVYGGILSTFSKEKDTPVEDRSSQLYRPAEGKNGNSFIRMMRYAFIDFMGDIAKWLVIGLLLAAFIALVIPDDFFGHNLGSPLLSMLVVLLASIPLYVCATASVPIAAVLMLKGLSPGAALVFLMAGPATNVATMTVIGKTMGKKTLYYYLLAIISGAVFFGLLIDYTLPASWFIGPEAHMHHEGVHSGHEFLPAWIKIVSNIIFVGLIGYHMMMMLKRIMKKKRSPMGTEFKIDGSPGTEMKILVKGMDCSHCKRSVETNLSQLPEMDTVNADLDTGVVKLSGKNFNLEKIRETIEKIGYEFGGVVK